MSQDESGGKPGRSPLTRTPFWIVGATTGDILVVEVLRVRPNHHLAGAQRYSDFGAWPPTRGYRC